MKYYKLLKEIIFWVMHSLQTFNFLKKIQEKEVACLTYLEYAKHLINLFSTSLFYYIKCFWFLFFFL